MKNRITNEVFGAERALYAIEDTEVFGCSFEGDEDGESALKECRKVRVHNCRFALRYPLWHAEDFSLCDCTMTDSCRAPMWYTRLGTVRHCRINGVKALRECEDTLIEGTVINSPEFGWKCKKTNIRNSDITSEYFLFESKSGEINNIRMSGKYSFQYVENMTVSESTLNTKDAFWHAKNITVTDSEINGEYLGWYSENLTFINCRISGTQPFCYCKNLRLINCTMDGAELAFEYSDVNADISGHIISVKNPRSGLIRANSIGEIIKEGAVIDTDCRIEIKQ